MIWLVLLVFLLVIFLLERWIDGLDLVLVICRDAGMLHTLPWKTKSTDIVPQHCGIRN